MRAVAYKTPQPIANETALIDVDLPVPRRESAISGGSQGGFRQPGRHQGARRRSAGAGAAEGSWLGCRRRVKAVGPKVTLFKPGDEVFYAGAIDRPGTNAELHLVDERIVGRKPQSLDFAAASALPLTAITAWETIFDRLRVNDPVPGAANAVLIIGGAGGVGSIAIQLLRALTNVTVIATASRAETREWALKLGAHHVLDHSRPLAAEIEQLALGAPAFVFSTTNTDKHVDEIAKLIAPQGRFALIDDLAVLDVTPFKRKSVSIHWEMMFARPLFGTPDMIEQHNLLNRVAELVDGGKIRTTLTETLGPIDAATLRKAHQMIETGRTRGKLVLAGF